MLITLITANCCEVDISNVSYINLSVYFEISLHKSGGRINCCCCQLLCPYLWRGLYKEVITWLVSLNNHYHRHHHRLKQTSSAITSCSYHSLYIIIIIINTFQEFEAAKQQQEHVRRRAIWPEISLSRRGQRWSENAFDRELYTWRNVPGRKRICPDEDAAEGAVVEVPRIEELHGEDCNRQSWSDSGSGTKRLRRTKRAYLRKCGHSETPTGNVFQPVLNTCLSWTSGFPTNGQTLPRASYLRINRK